ncbi:MAG: aldehyde dehydrogenase family protein [Bacteroidetes bacterium]|nr:aldehyde dehydrogenase family protein [Bacteroidota bacterium]
MERIDIQKTYKIYIGGQFPRTESGRFYPLKNKKGETLANICLSSKKDFRNAVVSARGAFAGWSARNAFNRSQILYRIAEMLEGRKSQFISEIILQGGNKKDAEKEVSLSIDRLVYYSGWCDKYSQIFSTVNPVSSSHFNFSVPEPTGVVSLIAPEENSLIGLVSVITPVIASGNTCVVLASETKPLCAVTFAEVLNSSDVPAGVVNILTGKSSELLEPFSNHMDVNAIIYCRKNSDEIKKVQENSSLNVKRCFIRKENWLNESSQNPYFILDTTEIKTTWHPVENIGSSKTGY